MNSVAFQRAQEEVEYFFVSLINDCSHVAVVGAVTVAPRPDPKRSCHFQVAYLKLASADELEE
jgi:hypothetical protein